jgi:hypothetical protein
MTDKATVWRHRAEELRSWAEEIKDPQSRADLLKAAAQWDQMAEQNERRLAAENLP